MSQHGDSEPRHGETRRDTERHGETRRDTETEESGAGHTESSPGLDRWALTHQTRSPEPERDEIMNHNLCGYRISEEPFYYYSVYCTPVDVQKVENEDIFIQMCSLQRILPEIFTFHPMYLLHLYLLPTPMSHKELLGNKFTF